MTDHITGYASIDKPWLKYYSKEEQQSKVPQKTVYQNVYDNNKDYPQSIAVNYFGKKQTFEWLFESVNQCAYALSNIGVAQNDCVTLCTVGTPETIILVLACNKIGALANFINPLFTEEQMSERINETGAKILFVLDRLATKINSGLKNTCIEKVIVIPVAQSMPALLKAVVSLKGDSELKELLKNDEKYFAWSEFIVRGKPWLSYYSSGAEKRANAILEGKTVWDVLEERLERYIEIPALEYFGRTISRKEFINDVYEWAVAFRNIGIKENEVIPYYGVFTPDICAITLALNIIGACPYFLKLKISPKALAEETASSRMAIVFDQLWEDVQVEFSKEKYEKVIIVRITDAMPVVKKQLFSVLLRLEHKIKIPKGEKYLSVSQIKKRAIEYEGDIKAAFVPERPAFITSSSGTTVDGVVKGTIATNESTISQLYMGDNSDIQFFPGDRCLNHFPPTASTSLNVLFFLAIYQGETVIIDPRVSEEAFFEQLIKTKPNQVLSTGSAWESFFNRIVCEQKHGRKFNFRYAKGWYLGGEGSDFRKLNSWNEILKASGAENGLFSGYGCSELFSVATTENPVAKSSCSKDVISVGIPYAGINMGVFDIQGNELTYNQRGELWIKSKSAMKEYYNKPELTAKTKIDGWIHTGDIAEIDEQGFLYIWGRLSDTLKLPSGREIYLFDVANRLKKHDCIDDAMVFEKMTEGEACVVAHIVWNQSVAESEFVDHLVELNEDIETYEPELNLCAYVFHDGMLPYSPTTLKKDRNRMANQTEGYVQVENGKLKQVIFPK